MSIADTIRAATFEVRDILSRLDDSIRAARSQCAAAEERAKRCGTEITRQRTLENERKRSLNAVSDRAAEAQNALDEAEKRRQEALADLVRCQEEQAEVAHSLREAQAATHTALSELRKEQTARQNAEAELAKIQSDRAARSAEFDRALEAALAAHLREQAASLAAAFASYEEKVEVLREVDALKKARHSDPVISKLCEQREELRKLLATVVVPENREIIEASLAEVERQLGQRFPKAVLAPTSFSADNKIDELLYFCNRSGRVVLLLPIHETDWTAVSAGDVSQRTANAMSLVWSFIRGLNLKPEDGRFSTAFGYASFESCFGLEDAAILEGFAVQHGQSDVMRFVLTSVPGELQEALSHAHQDR